MTTNQKTNSATSFAHWLIELARACATGSNDKLTDAGG